VLGGHRMDALKILDKLDQIEVFYEPIYSADQHEVIAYEIIGQIQDELETIKIEKFTYATNVPIEIRVEIEQMLVKQALENVVEELNTVELFVPCNPNLLMNDIGESYLNLLMNTVGEERLHLITLVLKEHLYKGDIKSLQHVVRYFKTYGIKFALSDVGEASHLENILLLEPSIIKLHSNQLNYNKWGARNPVFSTLRSLAFKIGASLLLEYVETSYQLHQGWKHGVRYYKGEYLEKPSPSFIDGQTLKERFRNDCEQFIVTERKILEQKYDKLKQLEKDMMTVVEEVQPHAKSIESLHKLAAKMNDYAFRIYICDEKGFQLTPNVILKETGWQDDTATLGKNWSWRPYFLLNLIKLRNDLKGDFTQCYIDIETNELTRTFSLALRENEYLFVDISYTYLYENNIVQ
jgi:EAL domain-containing protein (putative c-di-GMP-specific phosphodiesterase class I)